MVSNQESQCGAGALVVTPTYNEAANLREFTRGVLGEAPGAHLLIVDDNSPDGTGQLADQLAAADPRVHVLHRPEKLGLGTAYVAGFRWGLARSYATFFEMDADLSHGPQYLPAMLELLEGGADVVTGSRNVPGGGVEGWGLGRHVLSKGGSWYARLILGVPLTDLTTGFKGYTRAALERIDVSQIGSNGYAFQIETTYRALGAGLTVRELPIVFVDRHAGQSKMSRKIFLEAVTIVWKLRFARGAGPQ